MKNDRTHVSKARRSRGFALVTTLILMVLLSLLAVGMLGLSSVSLRGSAEGSEMARARANARLALMLAIGELQSELGPDRRVNCPAGMDPAALPEHSNWLAVYDSWSAEDNERPDPSTSFRRYLVSGDREALASADAAKTALSGETIKLVGEGTLGTTTAAGAVSAGLVDLLDSNGERSGSYSWWIGDNNSKAMVNAGRDVPDDVSDDLLAKHAAQSAPGTGFQLVDTLSGVTGTGRGVWEMGDVLRAKSPTIASLDLLPESSGGIGAYFHDVTTSSPGLLSDVRNGRLRRDLSLYLQREMTNDFRNRLRQPLYSVPDSGAQVNFSPDSEESSQWNNLSRFSGITMEELWIYYNLHKEVSYNRPASNDPKVGIIPGGYPTLVSGSSREDVVRDPFYTYKREIYSQVKYILSLAAAPNTSQPDKYDLLLSVDPVVVLWNPNNVAIEYQTGGFTTVGYSALPYEISFEVTGSTGTNTIGPVHFDSFFGGVNGIQAQVGKAHKIILRPGESRVLSTVEDKSQGLSVTVDLESGWEFTTGAVFKSANFPKALEDGDKVRVTLQPNINSPDSDYITYWFGPRKPDPAYQSGTITLQNDMAVGTELPVITTPTAYPVGNILAEQKIPMMLFSYYQRPERDTDTPSKPWIWNNPAINYRWPADNSLASKLHRQLEMKVVGLDTWENPNVQITPDNQAYWGGGVRADFGVPFFTFRSVPLIPPHSLAALQHSSANGFRRHWRDSTLKTGGSFPSDAYGLDGHQYLAPMVSKAIGNSYAQPLIPGDRAMGTLYAYLGERNGGTPENYNIADHSYLANAALWDSWYFSSLAPQTTEPYGSGKRTLQEVFDDFFPISGDGESVPLPSVRMRPYRPGDEAELRELVVGGTPSDEAYQKLAAYLYVDGAFNVNSTSVTAWKAILGSLRGHGSARLDRSASSVSVEFPPNTETPVNGLIVANGPLAEPSGDPQEPDQWAGFRSISDDDIDVLATALVDEIRLRGPFLCLSDFINRRPGNDDDLARQGALQAAIEKSGINGALESGSRSLGSIEGASFPESGEGSRASGIPGYITQADLLTPLGPILQARSDSFTIRAYGQTTDRNGKVLARACCEATVQRVPEYLVPADSPHVAETDLASTVNRTFGRQIKINGIRWLKPAEI